MKLAPKIALPSEALVAAHSRINNRAASDIALWMGSSNIYFYTRYTFKKLASLFSYLTRLLLFGKQQTGQANGRYCYQGWSPISTLLVVCPRKRART